MPIYEYQCRSCGKLTEVMQRVDDPPLTTCSECGQPLKKLISAPAFQFKGSGWYVTDYARKSSTGPKPAASTASADKSSESSASEGKKSGETTAAAPSGEGAG